MKTRLSFIGADLTARQPAALLWEFKKKKKKQSALNTAPTKYVVFFPPLVWKTNQAASTVAICFVI